MTNDEIMILLKEKGEPCVTIITPTDRLSPGRAADPALVNKSVEYAKALLSQKYPGQEEMVNSLMKKIEALAAGIDYTHLLDGIGIYVSHNIASVVRFPFPVTAKVKAGDMFDSRDLLYYLQTIVEYFVLSISRKYIHLFRGKGEVVVEVKNSDFPITYEETYEYDHPVRGTSYGDNSLKEFERDKTVVQEIRLKSMLRAVDPLLEKYIGEKMPLVVSGGKKEIKDFVEITRFEKNIAGKVSGNYHLNGDQRLAALSWIRIQSHLKKKTVLELVELRELIGKNLATMGIENAWVAANEGNTLVLYMEKDFKKHGFIVNDGLALKLLKPAKKEFVFAEDAAELIIRKVLEKRGRVVFAENGDMKDFEGIAMRLRYTEFID